MTFPLVTGVSAAVLALENAAVSSITTAQTAIDAVGVLEGAPASLLAPAIVAVQDASAALDAAIDASDATIVSGIEVGGDPALSVAYLEGQFSAVSNTGAMLSAKDYIDRVAINLALQTG